MSPGRRQISWISPVIFLSRRGKNRRRPGTDTQAMISGRDSVRIAPEPHRGPSEGVGFGSEPRKL
ncbi:uncharacterized protein PGTG_22584 [Puccinia graminis f. sp. tritici CRL 75-36-700-3]|uniref:Uncharacterized protein n=1 Tax=Puccinia graminis f. sp. tritici (strain CRL 75-36-700-3 / race SCCL) TaxID=418459 RepID=H6QUX2_PUCGT|nr:uncharacterized protein PGTG_22584 [Puccinia graminis f. sp. tritici CRL 75-36-700-3]EHS62585.1 hypothetical protein PGTG_22584 [Puccinia graminis f. sp. tritici CRL 75-36-700-3]